MSIGIYVLIVVVFFAAVFLLFVNCEALTVLTEVTAGVAAL